MATQQPAPHPQLSDSKAIEREQEALLKAKYGNLKPKKKLIPKEHKYFDSADWALAKQGVKTEQAALSGIQEGLEPRVEPIVVPPRRISHLGEGDDIVTK